MNNKKYSWILYLISITIFVTILVQLYWNYKNYLQNKQQVRNEIQLSFNNAVEQYFAELSKKNFLAIVKTDTLKKRPLSNLLFKNEKQINPENKIQSIEIKTDDPIELNQMEQGLRDSLSKEINNRNTDTIKKSNITGFTHLTGIGKGTHIEYKNSEVSDVTVFKGKKATDSLKLIKGLQTIFISILNDSINYKKIDSILNLELKQKNIFINYAFSLYKNDTLSYRYDLSKDIVKDNTVRSKSTFFTNNQYLNLYYSNPIIETLRRSSLGILLSLLLSLAVIISLFYLLHIINKQKELAAIKNDLISNITHEFKTPITTVSTAIEALENFNAINDKTKTKTYLDISSAQLKKLNLMVEKLLETATLDNEKLLLNKEKSDIVTLLEKLIAKYRITTQKEISFNTNGMSIIMETDPFHFENAVSNIIDNAIKYGGDKIKVNITSNSENIEIIINDNGNGIKNDQQDKVFDKFYRIPQGNIHNIKGYGIGLYYAKIIIEKHGGEISLVSNTKNTTFKISLPN